MDISVRGDPKFCLFSGSINSRKLKHTGEGNSMTKAEKTAQQQHSSLQGSAQLACGPFFPQVSF